MIVILHENGISLSDLLVSALWVSMNKLLLICVGVIFSSSACCAEYSGAVKQIACHASGVSSTCLVAITGGLAGQPACVSGLWNFNFDGATAEGKNLLAILLAAQTLKSNVVIGGRGYCTSGFTSEALQWAYSTAP